MVAKIVEGMEMCDPTFHWEQIIQWRFDLAQMNIEIRETADLISKAG